MSLGLVPEPPAPPVRRLVHRDPVDPRFQAGLSVEMLHPAEDFQEYFLRRIRRIGGVGEDAVHQRVDGLVELADEPGVGFLGSSLQFRDDGPVQSRAPIALAKSPKVATPAMTLTAHLVL